MTASAWKMWTAICRCPQPATTMATSTRCQGWAAAPATCRGAAGACQSAPETASVSLHWCAPPNSPRTVTISIFLYQNQVTLFCKRHKTRFTDKDLFYLSFVQPGCPIENSVLLFKGDLVMHREHYRVSTTKQTWLYTIKNSMTGINQNIYVQPGFQTFLLSLILGIRNISWEKGYEK